jgi:hypothetical protein
MRKRECVYEYVCVCYEKERECVYVCVCRMGECFTSERFASECGIVDLRRMVLSPKPLTPKKECVIYWY